MMSDLKFPNREKEVSLGVFFLTVELCDPLEIPTGVSVAEGASELCFILVKFLHPEALGSPN